MPRPLEFDKETVLKKAMEAFWRKGFEATSLQDLLKAMGLSKSSFYQTFSSKEELFKTCLHHYQQILATGFSKGLAEAPSAFAFLEDYFLATAENRHKDAMKGCMLMNTATEFSQKNRALARLIKDGVAHLENLLTQAVQQAQKEGDIPKNRDPRTTGAFLVANISGLKTLAKAGTEQAVLKGIAATVVDGLRKK